MKISENKFVSIKYDLFVDAETDNGKPELMEQTTEKRPLTFIFGMQMMLPKFEEALFGMEAGDLFEFTLDNEDAYGPYDDDNIVALPRSIFEKDGKIDENEIFPGNIVPLMDSEGGMHQAQIIEITGTEVKVDFNHPLAGENLHFKGQILEVREPTNEELAAFLSQSCSCGCDEEGCESCEGSCNN
jgi:FKBP-type peptidyl-prolyl cis-trans isomerases 2